MEYTIVLFLVRLAFCSYWIVFLHKKWVQKEPYLTEYPFIEQLGVVVIYVGTHMYLVNISILGDPLISLRPTSFLFLMYLIFYLFEYLKKSN